MKDYNDNPKHISETNIGAEIQRIVKERGLTVVYFAQLMGCSRTYIYKIFEKRSINTNELIKISSILKYDFFKLFSNELRNGTSRKDS